MEKEQQILLKKEILRSFKEKCVGKLSMFKDSMNLVTDLKKIDKNKYSCNLRGEMKHLKINITFDYIKNKVLNIYVGENYYFMHFGEFEESKVKFGNMNCISDLEFGKNLKYE